LKHSVFPAIRILAALASPDVDKRPWREIGMKKGTLVAVWRESGDVIITTIML
jgi:hypothetical protein